MLERDIREFIESLEPSVFSGSETMCDLMPYGSTPETTMSTSSFTTTSSTSTTTTTFTTSSSTSFTTALGDTTESVKTPNDLYPDYCWFRKYEERHSLDPDSFFYVSPASPCTQSYNAIIPGFKNSNFTR